MDPFNRFVQDFYYDKEQDHYFPTGVKMLKSRMIMFLIDDSRGGRSMPSYSLSGSEGYSWTIGKGRDNTIQLDIPGADIRFATIEMSGTDTHFRNTSTHKMYATNVIVCRNKPPDQTCIDQPMPTVKKWISINPGATSKIGDDDVLMLCKSPRVLMWFGIDPSVIDPADNYRRLKRAHTMYHTRSLTTINPEQALIRALSYSYDYMGDPQKYDPYMDLIIVDKSNPKGWVSKRWSFPITGSETTVGRAPDNTIVIDDPYVSSKHFTILLDGSKYATIKVVTPLIILPYEYARDGEFNILHQSEIMFVTPPDREMILFFHFPEYVGLTVTDKNGSTDKSRFLIEESGVTSVGRSSENEIVIPVTTVSPKNLTITHDHKYTITVPDEVTNPVYYRPYLNTSWTEFTGNIKLRMGSIRLTSEKFEAILDLPELPCKTKGKTMALTRDVRTGDYIDREFWDCWHEGKKLNKFVEFRVYSFDRDRDGTHSTKYAISDSIPTIVGESGKIGIGRPAFTITHDHTKNEYTITMSNEVPFTMRYRPCIYDDYYRPGDAGDAYDRLPVCTRAIRRENPNWIEFTGSIKPQMGEIMLSDPTVIIHLPINPSKTTDKTHLVSDYTYRQTDRQSTHPDASRSKKIYLTITDKSNPQKQKWESTHKSFLVTEPVTTVGRLAKNTIAIPVDTVSREHLTITHDTRRGVYTITPLKPIRYRPYIRGNYDSWSEPTTDNINLRMGQILLSYTPEVIISLPEKRLVTDQTAQDGDWDVDSDSSSLIIV